MILHMYREFSIVERDSVFYVDVEGAEVSFASLELAQECVDAQLRKRCGRRLKHFGGAGRHA
jgi:hypothetical protein